jgi:uncharacterized protein with HEPN domain
MPVREWKFRIEDIIEALNDTEQLTREMTYGAFCGDNKTVKAVLYNMAVVGEAARHVPPESRALHPEISWREMGDMRDDILHIKRTRTQKARFDTHFKSSGART